MNNNGIVILAAGSSSRLGQPKQLLEYRNKSLIRHVTDEAISSATGPVIVVIGANATRVAAELKDTAALVRINEEWPEGMASSIRHGVKEMLEAHPNTQSVTLAVCDQPFVSATL
ncbi:MAG TPA: NTP transferase domain-containing protein, partial [Puia sp.]|nr:NTP transferase domain-containing protein [Puia sp.]